MCNRVTRMGQHFSLQSGVRTLAVFEGGKALLALAAGVGLVFLGHDQLQAVALHLGRWLHVNPAHHFPRIMLGALNSLTDARLWLVAGLALAYAVVRIVQAYGLWHHRIWAEWFGVLAGGIYVPIELYELTRGVSPFKLTALAINLSIVAFLGFVLARSPRDRAGSETVRLSEGGRVSE